MTLKTENSARYYSMKFIISLKFVIIFNWYFSQEKTLSLKLDSNNHIVNNYLTKSKINLISLRATSNLLTNNSLLEYNSIILPERKKAFIRHIKHINEKLEEYYFESRDIDSQAIELMLELHYLKSSFIQKGIFDMDRNFTIRDKIKLSKNTAKSKKYHY